MVSQTKRFSVQTLVASVAPLGKALYHHCLVPHRGLQASILLPLTHKKHSSSLPGYVPPNPNNSFYLLY